MFIRPHEPQFGCTNDSLKSSEFWYQNSMKYVVEISEKCVTLLNPCSIISIYHVTLPKVGISDICLFCALYEIGPSNFANFTNLMKWFKNLYVLNACFILTDYG